MTSTTLTNRNAVSTLSFVQDALMGLRRAHARAAARRHLLRLDDRMLLDIGLTRHDVTSGNF